MCYQRGVSKKLPRAYPYFCCWKYAKGIHSENVNASAPKTEDALLNSLQEFVDHAWYRYPNDQVGRHPFDGITDPWYNPGDVKGSDTNIQQLNEQERYSWIKAPRWRGNAMEVGPLARTLIAYHKGAPKKEDAYGQMETRGGQTRPYAS